METERCAGVKGWRVESNKGRELRMTEEKEEEGKIDQSEKKTLL